MEAAAPPARASGDEPSRVGRRPALRNARHPDRDRCAAGRAELLHLGEVGDRENARHDRNGDPRRRRPIAKAQKEIDVEKVLGDRADGPGIDLALQVVDIVLGALRLGMGLGIGGDADLEIGDLPQPGDKIGGIR
jgi:hypothetical protein